MIVTPDVSFKNPFPKRICAPIALNPPLDPHLANSIPGAVVHQSNNLNLINGRVASPRVEAQLKAAENRLAGPDPALHEKNLVDHRDESLLIIAEARKKKRKVRART